MRALTLAPLALTLAAAPALATQSAPVQGFNGTYDLACADSSLVLTISLSGVIGTAAGTWYDTAEAPIDCSGVDEAELDAFVTDLATSCAAGGLPYDDCYDLAEDIGQAIADLNNDLLDIIPQEVTMTVLQTSNWFNQLIGIYPMKGDHLAVDGNVYSWNYLVNNNDGAVNGDFAALGLAVGDSGTSGNLACSIVSAAQVVGGISRAQGYALDADFLIDQSLLCSVVEGSDWLLGTVSLAYVGTVEGAKAP